MSSGERMGLVLAEYLADLAVVQLPELKALKRRFDCKTSLKFTEGDGYEGRYRLQELWLEVIRRRKLNDKQAIAFISSGGESLTQRLTVPRVVPTRVPGARKVTTLEKMVKKVVDSSAAYWGPEDYDRLVSNLSQAKIRSLAEDLELAAVYLSDMATHVKKRTDKKS